MEQSLSITSFLEMSQPFSFFHKIFFKEGTEAANSYGKFVFGRFMYLPKWNKNKEGLEKGYLFKIDAPRINGNNKTLSPELKSLLYYKGVSLDEIDVVLSYPN